MEKKSLYDYVCSYTFEELVVVISGVVLLFIAPLTHEGAVYNFINYLIGN